MFTPLPPTPNQAVFPGVSEFGQTMASTILALPDARGAVLCDGLGDPIDFAYRTHLVSELDIQLCGAQLTQVLHDLFQSFAAVAMPSHLIMLEAAQGSVLADELGDEFVLVLLMHHKANLPRAMRAFASMSKALYPLLGL